MGHKDPVRKGKRRATPKPRVDDDLVELASVLAEYQLDNNAYGWFRMPWRDGRWAVEVARAAAVEVMTLGHSIIDDERDANALLMQMTAWSTATYEGAGRLYTRLVQPKVNTNSARLFAAGLRCLQLMLANSDGGGAVYNELLIPAFLPIEPALVENVVLACRCRDSIGTSHYLLGDRNDRQRAAFVTAWRRGLYLAAYSIQPAF